MAPIFFRCILLTLCTTPIATAMTIYMSTLPHNLLSAKISTSPKLRVVVVGGGVGGLAVAARVASSMRRLNSPPRNDDGTDRPTPSQDDTSSFEVLVLEKNSEDMVGGRCGSFDVKTSLGKFRHERGPSLLLLKDEYESLFSDCFSSSDQHGLHFKQCIPAYQVVFDDGDTVELGFPKKRVGNGAEIDVAERMSREKMNTYEPDGASKWDAYMRATSAFLDCGLPNFIEERFEPKTFPAFLREALRDGGKAWPLKPHSDVLDALFSSDKMRCLASFQDLYVGLEPYRNDRELFGGVIKKTAPAVFGLLSALELHPSNKIAGVFAPIGGFRAVGKAFKTLAEECGAKIYFEHPVTAITDEGVYVSDGTQSTSFVPADLVIVNADVPFATKSLIHPQKHDSRNPSGASPPEKFDWDDSFDFSSGVVAFHWSVDEKLNRLNTHNVFLVASNRSKAEESWCVLREKGGHFPSDPSADIEPFNFYVHRAVRTDPSAAPDGCDCIMVLVPCRNLTRCEEYSKLPREKAISKYQEQFSEELVDNMRESVLSRLAVLDDLKDLKAHIIDEVVDTPGSYADMYNLGAGVPFGLSHGFGQLSVTRPGTESKILNNALFVGASSRPGNGVPLVLLGAKSVAKKAMKRLIGKIDG